MKAKSRQSGITLTEMTVVIAVVALLVSLGLPAARMLFDSFESQSGARAMISAAMASARAIAAKEQRYVGVRFQKAYDPTGPLRAPQYMIFVVQDPALGAYFFRAVEGLEPIKLPDSVGVTDFTIVRGNDRNYLKNPANPKAQFRLNDQSFTFAQKDNWFSSTSALTDITTFSIIFSPSGKMVIHGIRVTNRNGYSDTKSHEMNLSNDDIFNKKLQVDAGIGMFYQDDYFGVLSNSYGDLGLGPEPSRRSFVIYDRLKFRQAYEKGKAYSGYLQKLLLPEAIIHINPYTGTMIEK